MFLLVVNCGNTELFDHDFLCHECFSLFQWLCVCVCVCVCACVCECVHACMCVCVGGCGWVLLCQMNIMFTIYVCTKSQQPHKNSNLNIDLIFPQRNNASYNTIIACNRSEYSHTATMD